jgi:hypothetical protein
MKQLVKEDFNYFQWDGIIQSQNEVIKNGFMQGMSAKRIASLVNLTPKEVEQRIKEMKLTKPAKGNAAN